MFALLIYHFLIYTVYCDARHTLNPTLPTPLLFPANLMAETNTNKDRDNLHDKLSGLNPHNSSHSY